jgi:ABC-2 type transport system ATP-binding protein
MALIHAQRLSKRFRVAKKGPGIAGALRHLVRPQFEDRVAVDAIDLAIDEGESVAYVGPNGAGKSTTIKMLTGILVPSAGEVRIRGLVPHRQRVQNARNIGVVFGQRTQLWWDIPVQESLRLLGDVYEVPRETFARTWRECCDLLDLGPLLARPARQLSLGQRMRCDLAASLLHAPPILYLDEPTIGLDVAVKERMRQFIRRLNVRDGVTLLLTSHDLGDIEDLCRRLVMIDKGRIVFDGPLETIKQRFGRERVIRLVLTEASPTASQTAADALAGTVPLGPDAIRQPEPHRLTVQFDSAQATAAAVASRLLPVLPVHDFQVDEPSVESILRRLYEGTLALGDAVDAPAAGATPSA